MKKLALAVLPVAFAIAACDSAKEEYVEEQQDVAQEAQEAQGDVLDEQAEATEAKADMLEEQGKDAAAAAAEAQAEKMEDAADKM